MRTVVQHCINGGIPFQWQIFIFSTTNFEVRPLN